MRALLVCLFAAACAAPRPPGLAPIPAGDSRADGIVTMASNGSVWNPVEPDWRAAQATADRRCRQWGHPAGSTYAGWQEACRQYDHHGRCVLSRVTRFYACAG